MVDVDDASVSKRWRMVIATERAIALEAVGASTVGTSAKVLTKSPYGTPKRYVQVPATRVLEWMKKLDSAMSLADSGYSGIKDAGEVSYFLTVTSNKPTYRQPVDDWNAPRANLGPDVATLSWRLCELEDSRRLTVLAIAVKRFQLENGHWPKSLDDLSMPSNELAPVGGERFQLKVDALRDSLTLFSSSNSTNIR